MILALANTLMGKSSVPSLSCWPSDEGVASGDLRLVVMLFMSMG